MNPYSVFGWSAAAVAGAVIVVGAVTPETTPGTEPLQVPGSSAVEILTAKTTADSLFDAERYEEAVPVLQQVVAHDPHHPHYWRALGRAAARTGRHDEAIPALVRARELGIYTRWRLAVEIARSYAALDSTDAALRWLEDALDDPLEHRPVLQSDPELQSLHGDPRFREIVGLLPERPFDRVEGWRYDLDFFVREAKRMHVAPHRPAHGTEFAETAARLRERIPALSDTEIYIGLRKLAVMLDDGHTGIAPQGARGLTRLPLDLYAFRDGLVVVGGGAGMIGHRVLGFGSVPTEEALDQAAVFVGRDNPMSLLAGLPGALVTVPYLADLGLTNDDGSVTLRMEAQDGRRYDTTLVGRRGGFPPSPRRLTPPAGAPGAVPRYMRDNRTSYWLESLPEHDALYLNFNAVRNGTGPSLEAFGGVVQARLQREGTKHLIVDVRMNGGGNSFLFVRLLRAIIHFGQDAPDHRIYVLTSRHTFSAAQNFINKIEQFTDAVFVGEPAGSRPNFTGESARTRLPYSGLTAYISTRNHMSSDWTDARIWIAPDVPVALSSADYFANRDPVFDAVVDLIASHRTW